MTPATAITASILLIVVDNLARAVRIQRLLSGGGTPPSLVGAFAVNAMGEAISAVTPFRIGGEASRIAGFQRVGIPPIQSVIALTAEAATSYPVLIAFAAIIAALWAPSWWEDTRASWPTISAPVMTSAAVALIAAVAAAMMFARRRRRTRPANGTTGRWRSALRALPRSAVALSVPLSAISIIARVAILPVLVAALPDGPAIGTTTVASFALLYGQLLLPTPSGVGAVDYGFLSGAAGDLQGRGPYLLGTWRVLTTGVALALGTVGFLILLALVVARRGSARDASLHSEAHNAASSAG